MIGRIAGWACMAVMLSLASLGADQTATVADPAGVLKAPIPDRLVVLTFDDGPLSGYTVVAPILKSFGFGGSFYVCDFDSFRTRKDWYMTWRQMKALSDQGFEIGNHTTGHAGGCRIGPFLSLEDDLVANGVPKPTTIAWPVHAVNTATFPELVAAGYTFGRGGHSRPYRPTVDNPFDIPSMGAGKMEHFVRNVRQAAGGNIVVLIYHGVPDIEHAAVSLDPALFKAQMQYLKDNDYKVIALRELAEYIDPVKAATLPPTARHVKESASPVLAREKNPYVAMTLSKPTTDAPRKMKPVIEQAKDVVAAVTPINAGKPNVFTWNRAEAGNWSDGSRWSNNLANGSALVAGGQSDYVLNFDRPGNYTVTSDLDEDFVVNRLNFNGPSVKVLGKSLAFTANGATTPPRISQRARGQITIGVPVKLAADVTVDAMQNSAVRLGGVISGPGGLVKNGGGRLQLANVKNTYSGGIVINNGSLHLVAETESCGSGPITLNEGGVLSLERVAGTSPLVLNGGTIHAGNGFGDSWSGTITLNGHTEMTSYADFRLTAAMSGPGGFSHIGGRGAFGPSNSGQITLSGTNTYTGPTIVMRGTLRIMKAASLYNGDVTKWTPDRISVYNTATLRLCVGGPGEFTGEQIGDLLNTIASTVNNNGLMGGAVLCLNTSNAKETVVVPAELSDSKGQGGGGFRLKKCGAGTIALTDNNTYTGQTILECGALSVSSLNSYLHGKASSSLGAPTDIEAGEIVMGERRRDGDCALIYTGAGEVSDRVINLAGKTSTVTFDQSGTGLLKLTSTFLISGHSASKTIALKGNTAGTGEIAGNIFNPHDRAGKATTAVTKSGTGMWSLSGVNTYTGATKVEQGLLSIASAKSLSDKSEVYISDGAMLELNFRGEAQIAKLTLGGTVQPAGKYSAANAPDCIQGAGSLRVK